MRSTVSSSSVSEMRGDRRGLCSSCDLRCISCWHFELHLCGFWLWMDDMPSTRSTHNSQDAASFAAPQRLVRLHRRVRRFLLRWTSSKVGIACSRGKCLRFKWTNQISKQVRTADTNSPLKKREWDWITEEVLPELFLGSGVLPVSYWPIFFFPVPCNSPSHGGHISVPEQWNGGHVGVPNQSCGS